MAPPRADLPLASVSAPSSHVCMKIPATRAPTAKRIAPGPTSTTSPAPSDSGVSGTGRLRLYVPLTTNKSR